MRGHGVGKDPRRQAGKSPVKSTLPVPLGERCGQQWEGPTRWPCQEPPALVEVGRGRSVPVGGAGLLASIPWQEDTEDWVISHTSMRH